MSLHPSVLRALEEIDAQLFSAPTEVQDRKEIGEYVQRWVRRLDELRYEGGSLPDLPKAHKTPYYDDSAKGYEPE